MEWGAHRVECDHVIIPLLLLTAPRGEVEPEAKLLVREGGVVN